jgi:hypothetical protein
MTPQQLMAAPVAVKQHERTLQQLRADDAQLRSLSAPTPELRALWQLRFEQIREVKP